MAQQWRRKSKFFNKPTIVDGIRFHSIKESRRYKELLLEQKAGKIKDLKLQPVFEIWVNGRLICRYISDFQYIQVEPTMQIVVEDVKGVLTDVYKLKKKLFLALYPQYVFVES